MAKFNFTNSKSVATPVPRTNPILARVAAPQVTPPPLAPELAVAATPDRTYLQAAKDVAKATPAFLWSNVMKPVVRGVSKPFFGVAGGVLNEDINLRIPGTSTDIGTGTFYADNKAWDKSQTERTAIKERASKDLGQDLGDALAIGSTVVGGGMGRIGKTANAAKASVAKAGGGKVMQYLAKTGVNATGDAVVGSGVGAASALARGEKDPAKIWEEVKSSAAFSAALPIGFDAVGGAMRGLRKLAARAILGSYDSKFGDALKKLEIDLTAKEAAQELARKAAEFKRGIVKGADGKILEEFEKRHARGNFIAPEEGRNLPAIGTALKEWGEAKVLHGVRAVRRINDRFFDDEAPMNAMIAKIEEVDPDAGRQARVGQSEYQARKDIAVGRARENLERVDTDLLKGDVRLQSVVDEMSGTRTKLETERASATPEALAELQGNLDRTLAQLSPSERALVEEAHALSVKQSAENLDILVEGGVMSAERAAELKAKYPNYSKLMVKEYMEGGKTKNTGRGSGKAANEPAAFARDTEAGLDMDTLGAHEANFIATVGASETAATNKRLQNIVYADQKNGMGEFDALWTKEDEAAKKALIGQMQEQAGIKDALLAEQAAVKKGGKVELGKQKAADKAAAKKLANEIREKARATGKSIRETYDDLVASDVKTAKAAAKTEGKKQQAAITEESRRLAAEIRKEAQRTGKSIRETYDSLLEKDVAELKAGSAAEIKAQTRAATKEGQRQGSLLRSLGKGESKRAKEFVAQANDRSYNQATRDAAARELGILEDVSSKFKQAGREQAGLTVAAGKKEAADSSAAFLARAENEGSFNQGTRDALQQELGLLDDVGTKFKQAGREQADLTVAAGKDEAKAASFDFLKQAEDERWAKITAATDAELVKIVDEIGSTNEAKIEIYQKLKTLRDKAKVAANSETAVPVWDNGVKQLYEPKDPRVSEYFNHQIEQGSGKAFELMASATKFTKKYATQLNPVFNMTNYIRDQQDRVANLGLSYSPLRSLKALGIAWKASGGKYTKEYLEALKLGGPLSSAGYDMVDGTMRLTKPGAKTPSGFVKRAAEASEMATRINILDEAKRAGITDPVVLRDMMRNGTLDFSVAGSWAREANKVMPFLTASINGVRTQMKALAKDPSGYARRQQMLAIYPQTLLEAHNSQYESSKYIPEKERENNHIFIYGEGKDADGRPYAKRIKIPKGQSLRIFANIARMVQNDNLSAKEIAYGVASQFMKMVPTVNTESSIPIPLPFGSPGQAVYGMMLNKDYMGRDIVPQSLLDKDKRAQVNKYTTDLAKDLGAGIESATGLRFSPAKIEYVFRTMASGLGNQAFSLASNTYDVARGKKVPLAQMAGAQTFLGESNTGRDPALDKKNQEAKDKLNAADYEADQTNEKALARLKAATTEDQLEDILGDLAADGVNMEKFTDFVKKVDKKKKSSGGVNASAPTLEQAVQLQNLLDQTDSKEEYNNVIKAQANSNILTESLVNDLTALQAWRKLKGKSEAEYEQAVKTMVASGEITSKNIESLMEYKKAGL